MNVAQSKPTVAVIGAGIVGITAALELQSAGYQVTLLDRSDPGTETSFGNASFIAVEIVEPQATPTNVLSAIKLLFSEKAAFKVTPDYLLSFIPWGIAFLKETIKSRREKNRDAIIQLNKHSVNAWKSLLKKTSQLGLLRKSGYLQVWEKSSDLPYAQQLQRETQAQGIECELLKGDELFEKEPALSRDIKHALYTPESLQLLDPYETTVGLFDFFIQQGGIYKQVGVDKVTTPNKRVNLQTSQGDLDFDKLVVCAGVWSKSILKQLGLKVPLVVERGYHLTFPDSPVKYRHIILSVDRNVVLTPLKTGMRITGFAEFANIDYRPVEKRYRTLSNHLEAITQDFDCEKQQPSEWMGNRSTLPDSLPVIDLHPKHPQIGMVFGHQHLGLTQAPISAKIITALIRGDKNDQTLKDFEGYLEAFSVSRF